MHQRQIFRIIFRKSTPVCKSTITFQGVIVQEQVSGRRDTGSCPPPSLDECSRGSAESRTHIMVAQSFRSFQLGITVVLIVLVRHTRGCHSIPECLPGIFSPLHIIIHKYFLIRFLKPNVSFIIIIHVNYSYEFYCFIALLIKIFNRISLTHVI